MVADTTLAIAHHLLMFSLLMMLVIEMMTIRHALSPADIRRLAVVDQAYGMLAILALLVGACRVYFGAKGWEFYVFNWFFWAKMAAFCAVAALSIFPTLRILSWKRATAGATDFKPNETERATARRFMHMQAGVFVLIPIFAALMARGYGL